MLSRRCCLFGCGVIVESYHNHKNEGNKSNIFHSSQLWFPPVLHNSLSLELVHFLFSQAICNLGVWCISIQQLSSSFIASHLHSLLRAVMHALENPIGSPSTTFEAIQVLLISSHCLFINSSLIIHNYHQAWFHW